MCHVSQTVLKTMYEGVHGGRETGVIGRVVHSGKYITDYC